MDRTISTAEAQEARAYVESCLEPGWLQANLTSEVSFARANPLVEWLANQTSDVRNTPQPSLGIVRLADDIRLLRELGVNGVEDRVSKLGASETDFRSAEHELHVAAFFSRNREQMHFIPEAPTKTPDFLLSEAIEVECKYKTNLSSKDARRRNAFDQLRRRMRKLLEYKPGEDGLRVELELSGELDKDLLDEIFTAIREVALNPRIESKAENRENGAVLYRIQRTPSIVQARPRLFAPSGYDYASADAALEITDDLSGGRVINACVLAARFKTPEDSLGSLRRSIRSGCAQLSGDRPGVVAVEVTSLRDIGATLPMAGIEEVITECLRANRRLSAIFLMHRHFEQTDDSGWRLEDLVEVARNPDADHPVPTDWADFAS